jgi:transcription elongation factor GreA
MPDLPPELVDRPKRKAGQEPTATLTMHAYQRLRDELEDLRARGRDQMAERLKFARELGDIRENAEYDAAKNEQGLMEARIRTLEHMLRDPEIVKAPVNADAVRPGMLVTVRSADDDDEDEETYLLADSAEERAPGARTVTTTSPLGKALVGARADEEVLYEAPGGSFRYLIVGFRPRD